MDPRIIAAQVNMRKIKAAADQRRADARKRGYRGPLTRDEASRLALKALGGDQK